MLTAMTHGTPWARIHRSSKWYSMTPRCSVDVEPALFGEGDELLDDLQPLRVKSLLQRLDQPRSAAGAPGPLELGADAVHAPGDVQRRGGAAGGRLRTHGWPSFAVMEELGCPHYFPPPFGEELLDQAERLALQKDFRRRWGRLPNLHGPVLAGAGQALAVLAERHAPDQVRVPLEGEEFLSGGRLPDLHKLVLAGGDEALAVWAVRHAGDEARVSFEAHHRSSQLAPGRRNVPDVHR